MSDKNNEKNGLHNRDSHKGASKRHKPNNKILSKVNDVGKYAAATSAVVLTSVTVASASTCNGCGDSCSNGCGGCGNSCLTACGADGTSKTGCVSCDATCAAGCGYSCDGTSWCSGASQTSGSTTTPSTPSTSLYCQALFA